MGTLGFNDLKQYALPAGWDGGRLTAIRLESGETYEQLLNDISGALVLANQALLADPLYAGLISVATEDAIEQRVGVSNGFEDHTEYGRPDAKRGKTAGWMLPLNPYDRMLGWTWDFLRKARRASIDADINSAIDDLKNLWGKKILTRLFKSTYDSVGSGKTMPIADGGTADSTYVPVAMPERGGTFVYTHTHLGRLDGITQANVETTVGHLWEHGYDGPFDLLVAQADMADWSNATNVTGWTKRPDAAIRYGAQTDLADVAADYLGVVETKYGAARLRATGRIPTKYWAAYKSYGPLDQRNPLIVKPSPQYGLGAVMLPSDGVREFPFENAQLFIEFGVGVQDRVGAAVVYNHDDNAYVIPTVS